MTAVGAHDRNPPVVFDIKAPQITESSSLVLSTAHRGLVYTANDSGDTATIYVLDAGTGALVGRTSLAGVDAVDVEAMSAGAGGTLVVADIGDNGEARSQVQLYRLAQPTRGAHVVDADVVSLTYPDGPRDAESVVYDSLGGRAYVVSKEASAHVYATPPDVFTRSAVQLRRIAPGPSVATDATMLPDGHHVVVRTYVAATTYRFPSWRTTASFPLPLQPQGESVAAPPGDRAIWIGTEGSGSEVLRVRLPVQPPHEQQSTAPPAPSSSSATSTAQTAADNERRHRLRDLATMVLIGAAFALALVAGVLGWRAVHHSAR
ncbi:MAG: hypothetical protein ACR2LE_10125 [Nocardioidaceae bacterium]